MTTKDEILNDLRNADGVESVEIMEEDRDGLKLRINLIASKEASGMYRIENRGEVGNKLGGYSRRNDVETRTRQKPKQHSSGGITLNSYDSDHYIVEFNLVEDNREEELAELDYNVGDFIYCSWGYNQTNIEFAKIVEISDTGKTVLARRVPARRLEGGDRVNKNIMPKDEPYGEPFRLQVRDGYKGQASFVGTYPTIIRDGEYKSTRKGYFSKWDRTSVRETRTGMGH